MRVDELMRAARERVLAGDLSGARERVEEAAGFWRTEGNAVEEARCLRLASALVRHEGRPGDAVSLAAASVSVAPEGFAAASREEAGKAALANGDPAAAAVEFELALAGVEDSGRRAGLEREYAGALLAAGRGNDAVAAYRRAGDVLSLVDGVARLQVAGRADLAEELDEPARQAATRAGDRAAVAQLALLATARALDRGDPGAARAHAERARSEALAGRSAAGYLGAAVALADLAEVAGDRVGAYASLAVGWVTLRDLVGADRARAAFQPRLSALRQRWGAAEFASVKAAYESAAQAARARTA